MKITLWTNNGNDFEQAREIDVSGPVPDIIRYGNRLFKYFRSRHETVGVVHDYKEAITYTIHLPGLKGYD